MKKIVTIGRGGTGKTSFVALMTKYFIETAQSPLLLVDADPDQSLAEMIGVDPKEQGKEPYLNCLSKLSWSGAEPQLEFLRRKEWKVKSGAKGSMRENILTSYRSESNGLKAVTACLMLL